MLLISAWQGWFLCVMSDRNLQVRGHTWMHGNRNATPQLPFFFLRKGTVLSWFYLCKTEAERVTVLFSQWPNKDFKIHRHKKEKKLEQLTTELSVLRKTHRLQCGFCSLAPPKIIVVFRLKFYSNLRHNVHWSSRRTWYTQRLKERNFISMMCGVQGMLMIFLCPRVCYHLGKVAVPWCPLEF